LIIQKLQFLNTFKHTALLIMKNIMKAAVILIGFRVDFWLI